jgi:S1-C subfamily serine protease
MFSLFRREFVPLLVGILALFQTGCSTKEPFVRVAEEAAPKSTSVYVNVIADVLTLTIEKGKFKIEKSTAPARYAGAGVFISENGHVLTCAHLFDASVITAMTVCDYGGTCQGAELLYKDDRRDLALLKIEGPTPYVRLADPRKLRVGQQVLAIGNPAGLEFTVTSGIISALNRDFSFRYNATQSDAAINPGNSGGPLFNLDGELVGINSFFIPTSNAPVFSGLGFSVSSAQIVEFLTRFRGIDKSIPKYDLGYWTGFLDAMGLDSGD